MGEALKIKKEGLVEYERVLKEIEESEAERVRLHSAVAKNAAQRGKLERKKFAIYLQLREVERALPAEEHKATRPNRAPEWSAFLPDEDVVGHAYGQRPFLIQR
jgi:hypothetical protein